MDENKKEVQMPIEYLSYSSLVQLLRNPLLFKMRYILKVYDTKVSMSGMIGRAGHTALKVYYGGDETIAVPHDKAEARELAIDAGMKYLQSVDDGYISYGKTGSREAMLKGYTQAMQFYFAEEPKYHEIVSVEEPLTAELKTDDGQQFPMPASCVADLIVKRTDGKYEAIDTKFTISFTDHETEDYIKIIQAQFIYHAVLAAKGIKLERVLFREIKRTGNKDGGNQIRDYAIPFSHEPYKVFFYNIFCDAVRFLKSPDAIYLPNLSDPMDGEHAGLMYAQGLISGDMSDVEVMHKVRDVAMVSKKFVASRLERAENKHLPPEERVKVRLAEFGVPVEPLEAKIGASVTQYRFKVSSGIRMSTIKKHKDDIAAALQAKGELRLLLPIPGTDLIGIEVENPKRKALAFDESALVKGTLKLPIGKDSDGTTAVEDLRDMPHLLIAGATGSGKSVLLHAILRAITKEMTPDEMQLTLIDPKRVEMREWRSVPHLRAAVTDHSTAVEVLDDMVEEMKRRYEALEKAGKRDIIEYNARRKNKLPYRVVVIDEFADLMLEGKLQERKQKPANYTRKSMPWLRKEIKARGMRSTPEDTKAEMIEWLEADDAEKERGSGANVEELMVRLAQLGRAAGIHLIIATQRPSVDVITGLIKANFPTRIALTTASRTDSEVILGVGGAEKLSGKGDMLFMHPAARGLQRLQGFALTK